jgi:hypothetical protein
VLEDVVFRSCHGSSSGETAIVSDTSHSASLQVLLRLYPSLLRGGRELIPQSQFGLKVPRDQANMAAMGGSTRFAILAWDLKLITIMQLRDKTNKHSTRQSLRSTPCRGASGNTRSPVTHRSLKGDRQAGLGRTRVTYRKRNCETRVILTSPCAVLQSCRLAPSRSFHFV